MGSKKVEAIQPAPAARGVPVPAARGVHVLCIAAGAALVLDHLLTGVLLTPFLGAEAFVWANVLGSVLVALGIGTAAGEVLGKAAGGPPRGGFRLVALAGILIVLATWALPVVARAVLDRDPDSPWAPSLVIATLTVLPGVLLVAVVPAVVETATPEDAGATAILVRRALRRLSLAMLGGTASLALAAWPLRHAEEARIHLQLYGLGALLVVLGAVGMGGPGRAIAFTLLAALAGVVFGKKSEIHDERYQAALSEAFVLHGAGRYYAETCPDHVITGTELQRKLDEARKRLKGNDRKIAVLLVVETLRTLGPLNLSGTGLKGLLQIYLPEASKPLILPFIEQIASVQSDGKKMHLKIVRSTEDGHAHFRLPAKDGTEQEYEIEDDFDLTVLEPDARTTKIEIGPQVISRAGLFEFNDTVKTPFRCKNVALWVDACLLALTVENGPDTVILSASAQASVGKVQTRVLQTIDKATVK